MEDYVLMIDPLGPNTWFARDAVGMGYKVLVAFPSFKYANDAERSRYENYIISAKTQLYRKADYVNIPDDVDQATALISGYNIKAVINGSNRSMKLTDGIAKKLGLPGNNPKTSLNRVVFDHAYECLKKNGLRTIKTAEIKNEEDILEFWNGNGIEIAVLNPIHMSGDRKTCVCNSVEETVGTYRRLIEENENSKDPAVRFVIQEYVKGLECVVDVANYAGTHKILDVWVYKVTNVDGRGVAMDYCSTTPHLFPGARECMKYAMDVLNATDYNYGLASVEIIIDSDGPVLLDINRKCMGYSITPDVVHKALGHHNTDVLAMGYFDTEKFMKWELRDDVKLVTIKSLMCNVSGKRRANPLTVLMGFLPSVQEFFMKYNTNGFSDVVKTVDFETPAGAVLLYHENEDVLIKDLETIRFLETNAPNLLFDTVEKHDSSGYVSEVSDIETEIKGKSIAILTDTGMLELQNGMYTNADMDKKYGGGIVLLGKEYALEKRYKDLSNLYEMVKEGGTIWVLQSSYANMPYGAKGMEAVLVALGGNIEYPEGFRDSVIRVRVKHYSK